MRIQPETLLTALSEITDDLDAAMQYAKDKGYPAAFKNRLRATKKRAEGLAWLVSTLAERSYTERCIAAFVGFWHKITGRHS